MKTVILNLILNLKAALSITVIAALLSVGTAALAQRVGDDCKSEQVLIGNWAFIRMFTVAEGCLIQVTPINKGDLTYREYVFDQSGRFMIFNSIPGDYDTGSAQQNYFLLPVLDVPKMQREGNTMTITMANGEQVVFTTDSMFIRSMTGLAFKEIPEINLTPGGNFSIENSSGVVVNAGWAIGKRAYADPQAMTTITKGAQQCTLKNEVLFAYTNSETREDFYQPILKFTAPEILDKFLRAYCYFL